MSDEGIILIVVLVIGIILLYWLIRIGAALAIVFTAFVLDLPLIIMILVFILFPPTLIVFLIGWFMLSYNIGVGDSSENNESVTIEHESNELSNDSENV